MLSTSGCRNCDDIYREADDFLSDPANQVCTVDRDCVVELDWCGELESSYCGQIALSRRAAASSEWQEIRKDLRHCGKKKKVCSKCMAKLLERCSNGRCG